MDLTPSQLADLDERRRITLAVLATVGTLGAAFGIAALRGHLAYRDWRCGFRTCVVPPGWKPRR